MKECASKMCNHAGSCDMGSDNTLEPNSYNKSCWNCFWSNGQDNRRYNPIRCYNCIKQSNWKDEKDIEEDD